MFSPVLFRFSKPNYCLIFLFLSSSFHHLPCALSQGEGRLCDNLYDCGNITAGFPFWGEARPQPCGHPSLGLRCHRSSNSTYLITSGLMYRVLQVNLSASTLKLARQDFLGEFCNSSFSGEALTPELFELLPDYKTLFVTYLCNPAFHNPTNFTCPQTGVAFVRENDDYHENCGGRFNITVPASYAPEEKALSIAHLGSVLKEGFDVKLKIDERLCQECKSSGRKCAYEAATPVCCNTTSTSEIKCTPMITSRSSGMFLNYYQQFSYAYHISLSFQNFTTICNQTKTEYKGLPISLEKTWWIASSRVTYRTYNPLNLRNW